MSLSQAVLRPEPDSASGMQIEHGNPTEEELGALLVVLAAALADPPPPRENDDRPLAGGWNSYWHSLRQPFAPGREAWRGSLR